MSKARMRGRGNLGAVAAAFSVCLCSVSLAGEGSPTIGPFAYGPTSLPAESGINYTLSPFAGYLNLGSGTGSKAVGGTNGSIAFPIGHSFGAHTFFTAGSIGGDGIYDIGSNLFWRDPGLGLVGVTGMVGHSASFGGANFGSGGAKFEGYFGRFTPFATVGAFDVQSMPTSGYGSIGLAYYPIDDLQLILRGTDYGGMAALHVGVEYLLPQHVNSVATTVAVNGYVGNHGTSGAILRLKFLYGPTSTNNSTLITRRRTDDPLTHTPHLLDEMDPGTYSNPLSKLCPLARC